jgi:ABC-type nitrate/sulfonate/bicarbonate transport system permease component
MTGLLARRLARTLIALVASSVVILLLWQVAIHVLDVSPYIGKSPLEVWDYLFTDPRFGPSAAENRAKLLSLLGVTLRDAGVGFGFGTTTSVLLAVVFSLVPQLELMFLPLAMLMRTVPLVGFAPIIYIILGNGTPTVALIGTIIVFFPVLINVALGLRSASPHAADLVKVYGGNRWTTLRLVAFPTALPNLFASVKIAIPLSLVAAMLYEWLFSLKGLGGEISVANAHSLYAETWAIAVLVAAVSITSYNIVDFVEAPVLALWGPRAGVFDRATV